MVVLSTISPNSFFADVSASVRGHDQQQGHAIAMACLRRPPTALEPAPAASISIVTVPAGNLFRARKLATLLQFSYKLGKALLPGPVMAMLNYHAHCLNARIFAFDYSVPHGREFIDR